MSARACRVIGQKLPLAASFIPLTAARFITVATTAISALIGADVPSKAFGEEIRPVKTATAETRQLAAIYQEVAPAVVGLSCLGDTRPEAAGKDGTPGEYFGTGTIIDPSGLILTSITVVPARARDIRAYLSGGRERHARIVFSHPATELVLLALRQRTSKPEAYPWITLGDSLTLSVGQPAFTLGNAFRSIQHDDQVSLSAGLISGYFRLREKHFQSAYVGMAIETSAPINSGMDGGPLLDSSGRVIGLLSLNYSRNRWLGTAVPVHFLKPLLAPYRGWFSDRDESFKVYAGLELEVLGEDSIQVLNAFPGSPAALAGLRFGDQIRALDGTALESMDEFRRRFANKAPGDELQLEVVRGKEEPHIVKISLLGRF